MRDRMNILIIVLDAARRDRFGCYGYRRMTTPAMDDFARQAMVFERMVSPSPWTVPSHASLFTGLYPREHGADYPVPILAKGFSTMAEHLGHHGYSTVVVSNNPLVDTPSGLARGAAQVWPRQTFHPQIRRRWLRWPGKLLGLMDSGAAATGRKIQDLLPSLARPFFLFVNYMECHWKYMPPRRFERRLAHTPVSYLHSMRRRIGFRGRFSWEAAGLLNAGEAQMLNDLYDAELACADEAVGDLLQLLDRSGLSGETMVVLAADHGEMLGEHGMTGHGMALWQPLIQVPFIARIPGARAGRIEGLFQLNDVFPGICRVAGLPLPEMLERRGIGVNPFGARDGGRAFAFAEWRQWGEERIARRRRRVPRIDFDRWPSAESVQDRRYKLVVTERGEEALFDLATDPGETSDVKHLVPTERRGLWQALDAWRTSCASPGRPGFTQEEERAVEARLRTLGYM
jgi:arylsulfatase A-like enzyme